MRKCVCLQDTKECGETYWRHAPNIKSSKALDLLDGSLKFL